MAKTNRQKSKPPSPDEPSRESHEIAEAIADFGKAYTRWLAGILPDTSTTPARARLLQVLQCEGVMQMNHLGGRLSVTPRNVTKLVDALELEGLVERRPHPTDRRATLIQLTGNGAAMCKQTATANHSAIADLFKELSSERRRQLLSILRELRELLRRREG